MATASVPQMTADEFSAWAIRPENEGTRYELVKSVPLLWPLAAAGNGWREVGAVLQKYVLGRSGLSLTLPGNGVIAGRNPDTIRLPHLMLFRHEHPPSEFPKRFTDEMPRLVVEVQPATVSFPRMLQRAEDYLRDTGIPLMWIIGPGERVVFVCEPKSSVKVLDETDELTGNGVLPDFRCRVAELFSLPGQPQP